MANNKNTVSIPPKSFLLNPDFLFSPNNITGAEGVLKSIVDSIYRDSKRIVKRRRTYLSLYSWWSVDLRHFLQYFFKDNLSFVFVVFF